MAPAIRVQNARTDQELQVETVQPGKLLGDWHQCPWTFYNHLFRFGVCCLFIVNSATTTINENCTYIQNPNFPASYASSTALTFTVAKCATGSLLCFFLRTQLWHSALDVCSLRIDFESFHLGGPTSTLETGSCEDTFQITVIKIA